MGATGAKAAAAAATEASSSPTVKVGLESRVHLCWTLANKHVQVDTVSRMAKAKVVGAASSRAAAGTRASMV